MPLPLLALQDISLTFGAVPLLSGAALSVRSATGSAWSAVTVPENQLCCASPPDWYIPTPEDASPNLAQPFNTCRRNPILAD